jgi:hypothetical protein
LGLRQQNAQFGIETHKPFNAIELRHVERLGALPFSTAVNNSYGSHVILARWRATAAGRRHARRRRDV